MTKKQNWSAETTAHPQGADHKWALIYDATPGGRDNGDGTRSYSMRFPVLLLSDYVDNPAKVAQDLADILNEGCVIQTATIEREAELIYLRKHGKDGALWSANDSKDDWRDMAHAALELKP